MGYTADFMMLNTTSVYTILRLDSSLNLLERKRGKPQIFTRNKELDPKATVADLDTAVLHTTNLAMGDQALHDFDPV